uniref:Uncharacterized protein n=1 Tax=Arundo donax TaxID=35708 RepID=A0A0A9HWL9_ARUDO
MTRKQEETSANFQLPRCSKLRSNCGNKPEDWTAAQHIGSHRYIYNAGAIILCCENLHVMVHTLVTI